MKSGMAKACRQFEPVMVSMLLLLLLLCCSEWDLNLAKADLISSFKSEIRISTVMCSLSLLSSRFQHAFDRASLPTAHSIPPPIFNVFFCSCLNNLFLYWSACEHRHKGWKTISSILVDNSVIFPFVDLQITNGNQFKMGSTKLSNKLML